MSNKVLLASESELAKTIRSIFAAEINTDIEINICWNNWGYEYLRNYETFEKFIEKVKELGASSVDLCIQVLQTDLMVLIQDKKVKDWYIENNVSRPITIDQIPDKLEYQKNKLAILAMTAACGFEMPSNAVKQ